MSKPPLAVALLHYPVIDRRGDKVTTAVTNLDIHDIARAAKTYGVERFYLVTPVAEQHRLVERILAHWQKGHGATYNHWRGQALDLVTLVDDLDAAMADWAVHSGAEALPVLTGAARTDGISYSECQELAEKQSLLLVFGTGWGLAPELFERGWLVLAPISGSTEYNHLSVRSALAIILDRLRGNK